MATRHFEKRAHQRYPLMLRVAAEVTPVTAASQKRETVRFDVLSSNVSRGGMMVHYNEDRLQQGYSLTLRFPTPDKGLIQLVARVVWTRRNSINLLGRYSAGLSFSQKIPDESVNSMLAISS